MTPVVKATCIGMLAPVLWGMSVGIVRGVTEDFGLGPGFTIMYGVAFYFCCCSLASHLLNAFRSST